MNSVFQQIRLMGLNKNLQSNIEFIQEQLEHQNAYNNEVIKEILNKINSIIFSVPLRYNDFKKQIYQLHYYCQIENINGLKFLDKNLTINSVYFDKDSDINHITQGKISPTEHKINKLESKTVIYENDNKKILLSSKFYDSEAYGSIPHNYNQLIKYQNLIEKGIVNGVSINLRGRISKGLLQWIEGNNIGDVANCPDIELFYTTKLPSGLEYTFPLKNISCNNAYNTLEIDLNTINSTTNHLISNTDMEAIRSIEFLIKQQPHHVIQLLSEEASQDEINKRLLEISINIYKQKNLPEQDKIDAFNPIFNNNEKSIEFLSELINSYQNKIKENPALLKVKQAYLLPEKTYQESAQKVVDTIINNISVIRNNASNTEFENWNSDLGKYGITLDIEHIMIDAIQEVNKTGNKKGRSYQNIEERFLNVNQFKSEIQNIKIEPTYSFTETLYHDGERKQIKHNSLTDKQTKKLLTTIYLLNISKIEEKVKEYKFMLSKKDEQLISSLKDRIEFIKTEIKNNGEQINNAYQDKIKNKKNDDELKKVEVKLEELKFYKNKLEDSLLEEVATIEQHYQKIFSKSPKTLKAWSQTVSNINEFSSSVVKKYIYVINHKGEIILSPEKLGENISGRAAHSELAGGGNVFGAGEIAINFNTEGKPYIVEINNGSGHYRPNANCLPFIKEIFNHNGFDLSHALIKNSLGRFAKLREQDLGIILSSKLQDSVVKEKHYVEHNKDVLNVINHIQKIRDKQSKLPIKQTFI